MTSKDKILAALSHEPGPVPIDFGSNAVTGMHCSVVESLRDYYGLEKHPVFINEPYQMLGEVEDDLREAIGIDTDAIYPRNTIFGFDLSGEKEWRTPWGQIVRVPAGFVTKKDENGDELIYPKGDTSVPPSGRMPTNGYFFDTIIRQEPIDDDNLNVEDNLEEFAPLEDADLDYLAGEVERLKDSTRGVMANFGGTGLGDIALVPGPFLTHPKGIRDITEWYVSTVARPEYVHEIFARQTKIAIANLERIHTVVGDTVHAMFLCGTDFGTQDSTFCSPDTFRELYLPYYRQMTDWIHSNTNWKVFKHSCGAVANFMPLFIEAGIDIINPVQISAKGMDPVQLKKSFGDKLVFWGGGVDTQKTMAFGSPEEVKTEVEKSCRVFGEHGGFVFNAVHNVQAKSAVENVVAMIDAVAQFNRAGS
jgi:uroporphyrinogen-III decarboxylase